MTIRSVNPEVARRLGQRYIYAFFHEVMLFPAYYWAWPTMHILISDHRDGELITQVIRRLGFGVVRGSTTRGGARALREMTSRSTRGTCASLPTVPAVHGGTCTRDWSTWPAGQGCRSSVQGWRSRNHGGPGAGTGSAYPDPLLRRPASPPPVSVPPDADRDMLEEGEEGASLFWHEEGKRTTSS